MAQRPVIGKNDWLFVQNGANVIAIKCLTSHTITGSQTINNTVTKCGRKKSPQGDPDFQISGEGEIVLTDGVDATTVYSFGDLFNLMKAGTLVHVISGPASGNPVAGDETYEGDGYLSAIERTSPADGDVTFTFTFDMETLEEIKETT